jgi:hypothetical protein
LFVVQDTDADILCGGCYQNIGELDAVVEGLAVGELAHNGDTRIGD